jgi:murein DD-endopeptidase MepM/ murein hydrolase activator NlpD
VTFRLKIGAIAVAATSLVAVGIVNHSDGAPSLGQVEQRARDARAREGVLTSDVSRLNARIQAVQVRLAPVEARWHVLNNELVALRTHRQALTAQLDTEIARLTTLLATLKLQRATLAKRISAAYRVGSPTILEVLLRSGSISDASSVRENLERVTDQDKGLIVATRSNADESRSSAARIKDTRNDVFRTEQRVGVAEAEAAQAVAIIATEKNKLVAARSARATLLSKVKGDRKQLEAEARGLRARSAKLAAQIRSGSVNLPSTVTVGGSGQFSWPVNGPITSGFGFRWGRMHEGIDIGVGFGTPIGAAAAGTVIVAGWSGGYGNLVVVSHGTISTAYGHMSHIAVSNGQQVSRGTVLGAVGSTGHSTGPHLHFEVRVNGVPQNPVNYL